MLYRTKMHFKQRNIFIEKKKLILNNIILYIDRFKILKINFYKLMSQTILANSIFMIIDQEIMNTTEYRDKIGW